MMRPAIRGGLAVAAALLVACAAGRAAAQPPPETDSYCLTCHGDKDLSLALKDGTRMSLYVDPSQFARSVHGSQLICTDCHGRYKQNHPTGTTFPSKRAYAIGSYETCKKCHFDTYTRTLESVHYELLKGGLDSAPVCTDCHGAHNIQNPHAKRAMVSRSCATCHVAIYKRYAQSVHGKALVEEGNQDVPACAGCHTHHQIQQPGTTRFRLNSPEICIRCHGDQRLMAKYGIPTTVVQTYLADFHGVTASLTRSASPAQQQVVVTCVDCHGAHDIVSPRLAGADTMKATVTAVCAKCHKDASPSFPAAWLSHYEPSLKRAPLVWAVGVFYKIFIPFIIGGLCLQILLHLWRVLVNR